MLTSDNPATAQTVGTQASIAEVRGNLLPGTKLQAIGGFSSMERHGDDRRRHQRRTRAGEG